MLAEGMEEMLEEQKRYYLFHVLIEEVEHPVFFPLVPPAFDMVIPGSKRDCKGTCASMRTVSKKEAPACHFGEMAQLSDTPGQGPSRFNFQVKVHEEVWRRNVLG